MSDSPDIPHETLNPGTVPIHSQNNEGPSPFLDSLREFATKNGATIVQEEKPKTAAKTSQPAPVTDPKPAATKIDTTKAPDFTKAEVPATVSDDVPASIKSTKAAEEFKKLKAERDAVRQELETLKKAPAVNEEYATRLRTIEEEKKALSEQLRLLDIERHPEFQQKYNSRIEATHELIKVSAGETGELLSKLLRVPQNETRDAQIDRIISELPPSKQAKVGALMARIDEISTDRTKELNDAKTRYESVIQLRQQEANQQAEASKQASERTWSTIKESARALEVFEPKEGDESWNSEVNDRVELARRIFNGENDEADLAKAALWAAAAPKYRELLHAQMALNGKLQSELNKLRNSEAKVSTSTEPGRKAPVNDGPDAGANDFVKQFMKARNGG